MFGKIALAVLSVLGRRQSHPETWLHLAFRGHRPCRFRSNKRVVVPGLILVYLQPIPDAEYLCQPIPDAEYLQNASIFNLSPMQNTCCSASSLARISLAELAYFVKKLEQLSDILW